MPYLTIYNSDGDTIHRVTRSYPDLEDYGADVVEGLMFLDDNPDSNYWLEGTIVVLEVRD